MTKKVKKVSNKRVNSGKTVNDTTELLSDNSDRLSNGNRVKAFPKDELQAEILAADNEHPRRQ